MFLPSTLSRLKWPVFLALTLSTVQGHGVALHLRLGGRSSSTPSNVLALSCRNHSRRSIVKRAMLHSAVGGSLGPCVDRYTPSASSSVVCDAACGW